MLVYKMIRQKETELLKKLFAIFLLIIAVYEIILWNKKFLNKENNENNNEEKRHTNKRKFKHLK